MTFRLIVHLELSGSENPQPHRNVLARHEAPGRSKCKHLRLPPFAASGEQDHQWIGATGFWRTSDPAQRAPVRRAQACPRRMCGFRFN